VEYVPFPESSAGTTGFLLDRPPQRTPVGPLSLALLFLPLLLFLVEVSFDAVDSRSSHALFDFVKAPDLSPSTSILRSFSDRRTHFVF